MANTNTKLIHYNRNDTKIVDQDETRQMIVNLIRMRWYVTTHTRTGTDWLHSRRYILYRKITKLIPESLGDMIDDITQQSHDNLPLDRYQRYHMKHINKDFINTTSKKTLNWQQECIRIETDKQKQESDNKQDNKQSFISKHCFIQSSSCFNQHGTPQV